MILILVGLNIPQYIRNMHTITRRKNWKTTHKDLIIPPLSFLFLMMILKLKTKTWQNCRSLQVCIVTLYHENRFGVKHKDTSQKWSWTDRFVINSVWNNLIHDSLHVSHDMIIYKIQIRYTSARRGCVLAKVMVCWPVLHKL